MFDCSCQVNVPATLIRNVLDSDVNNLPDSVNILDCENSDSNALAICPKLTRPILGRVQGGAIGSTLSHRCRDAAQKQNPEDDHAVRNDVHAILPLRCMNRKYISIPRGLL